MSSQIGRDDADEVQFQLALPPELAAELGAIPEVKVEATRAAPERVEHELALETVAVIVTILVNAKELAPVCKRIAETVHSFFSRTDRRDARIKVIGERDQGVIEIRPEGTATTADEIRVIVVRR